MSTGHDIDGLWVGANVDPPELAVALGRVDEALVLLERYQPLQYRRLLQDLSRVWVRLLPGSAARFNRSARACELDTRFVLAAGTSAAQIASAIVHESTHARIASRGIRYDEPLRRRIELVCRRQELRFVQRLPDSEKLQQHLREWLIAPPQASAWADTALARQRIDGVAAGLLHLGVPSWAVTILLWFRKPLQWLRRTARLRESRH